MVHQLGINRDWDRSRFGLSFGIGAGEMRLIDMASAYQVVANMGVRVEPTMIMKIIDRDGKVVRDYTKPEGRSRSSTRALRLDHDRHPEGQHRSERLVRLRPWTNIGRPAALKTGTTDNLQDVLAIGYTPKRLTAIWMGNSDNSRDARHQLGARPRRPVARLHEDGRRRAAADGIRSAGASSTGRVHEPVAHRRQRLGRAARTELPLELPPLEFFMTARSRSGRRRLLHGGCSTSALRSPIGRRHRPVGSAAISGAYNYGRFSWTICGFGATKPSESPGRSSPPVLPRRLGPARRACRADSLYHPAAVTDADEEAVASGRARTTMLSAPGAWN